MNILFSPLSINKTQLKNRFVMAPMCTKMSDEYGFVKDFHLAHYGARAIGQVGLIILEATAVSPEGRITDLDLGIWCDDHIEGLTKLATMIKNLGSKAGIQIAHAGRKSSAPGVPISCSDHIQDFRFTPPKEMSLEDIAMVQELFVDGVKRAIKAGFDVIELHAAHGYLIHQFLSPITNRREDKYGGTFENRLRFLKELLALVREFYSGTLFVRISATDYMEGGLEVEDYTKIFQEIDNIDFIDVSTGGLIDGLDLEVFPAYQVPYAKTLKETTSYPVGTVGIINTPQLASEILQEKRADLIFLGRALLKNPHWVIDAAVALEEAIDIPAAYKRAYENDNF